MQQQGRLPRVPRRTVKSPSLAVFRIGISSGNNPSLRERLGFKRCLLANFAVMLGKQCWVAWFRDG